MHTFACFLHLSLLHFSLSPSGAALCRSDFVTEKRRRNWTSETGRGRRKSWRRSDRDFWLKVTPTLMLSCRGWVSHCVKMHFSKLVTPVFLQKADFLTVMYTRKLGGLQVDLLRRTDLGNGVSNHQDSKVRLRVWEQSWWVTCCICRVCLFSVSFLMSNVSDV